MSKRSTPEDATPAPDSKIQKTKPEYTLNINNAMDKAEETKSFKEIIALPPSALQGLTDKGDEMFAKLKIKTIEDMGSWKFFKLAKAIHTLAAVEEEGKRNPEGNANLNKALDKDYETKSFKEILEAPIGAFQGLADWVDAEFVKIRPGIKTVGQLAESKYFNWAESIITLSEFENEDHSSR